MFAKLFMAGGLSLDRLRALVEVGAAGSIVRASAGDPVKQSQYSRQIKELEEFFQVELVERFGKGIRLTAPGKELARISRFFLLGLSNFQSGCVGREQHFRIAASATFLQRFLIPVLGAPHIPNHPLGYSVEQVGDDDIERRLHDLTLDFGITTKPQLSRPLQCAHLHTWRLKLWVPKALLNGLKDVRRAFLDNNLPVAIAWREIPIDNLFEPTRSAYLNCDNFVQAQAALETGAVAAFLPDYFEGPKPHVYIRFPKIERYSFKYHLAWNPRLLRLNSQATRQRDYLVTALKGTPHAKSTIN